ncbi:MAG: pectinesterase A [Chloroflexi bacterium]|nr:pectinesterase A [Chloroflexota bacterium]
MLNHNANAVVYGKYRGSEGAIVDGVRCFSRVANALNAAPENSTTPFVILVLNGRYYEKLVITKPFITLVGEEREKTILTYDHASDTKRPDGTTYGTFGSASVAVLASDVRIENLTIENGFDYPANAAKALDDPTRFANPQAVALKTDQGSDRAVFKNVTLIGYQDTLYVNAGRSYFQQCLITGHVDFIFGAGQAVFDDCDIVSRNRGKLSDNGYITAASTLLSNPYGFLFLHCRLKKDTPALPDGTVALGRPWHPTTQWADGTRSANPEAVGCVVFKNCWMDSHITAKGWERMHGWDKNRNEIWFYPEDARFYEYGSTGPGAIQHAARRVLSDDEALKYTIENVQSGWNPRQ